MTYIFLYNELADYIMNCFRVHLKRHPEDLIHVVHYPVNPEAPFQFDAFPGLTMYNKADMNEIDLHILVDTINPEVLVCSGWADKDYNEIASGLWKKGVVVILNFDNLYSATLKQLVLLPFARSLFRHRYHAAWVSGTGQARFARKLGFAADRIFTGFYSIDTANFKDWYEKYRLKKEKNYPKIFLSVARYVPQKGLENLWRAFAEVVNEEKSDWELWCAGTGDGFESRMLHKQIKHLGFVQPARFEELVANCGVFILPSINEPWGVVVTEFAAAGFPLILSNRVGSGIDYLQEGINGISVNPMRKSAIKNALKKMMKSSKEELLTMGKESHLISDKYSAELWSDTLCKIALLKK